MKFAAVILVGGKSSRMGRDKADLQIGGQSLLLRQIQLAEEAGAIEVFISGSSDRNGSQLKYRLLPDRFSEAGPLAGIEAALDASTAPLLLVLAVDMPEITTALIRRLMAGCGENTGNVPQLEERIEPLAAVYPKAALCLATEMLTLGKSQKKYPGATHFAYRCVNLGFAKHYSVSTDEERCFSNVNCPDDWERFQAGQRD